MKKTILTIGALALILSAFDSCKKAGVGGDATIVAFLKHHGNVIPNKANYPDTVFVKFNTQDLPSDPTHNYDALFVGEAGEDHVHCPGLHTGEYYLYGAGWDTTINQRVVGGIAVKIKHKDRKDEIDLDIPVTED